ncbi:MAG: hypothetical protein ACI9U2_000350 [Bradymonadia bacterium]|jgi:hypothetical protein
MTTSTRISLTGAALLAALCFAPAWASAASAAPAVDAQLDAALRLFKAGQSQQALAALESVEKTATGDDAVQIQFFKARCLMDLNRPTDAKQALEKYIATAQTQDDRARGRRWMAKLDRRYFGSIRVECTDAKTRVALQSRAQPKPQGCPAQWDGLSPGRYTLKSGETDLAVEVAAGKQVTLNLDRDTRATSDLAPEPTPVRFGWGGFARAGGSFAQGTVDETTTQTAGAAIGAGAFADLIWGFSAVDLGVRAELGYRSWQFTIEGGGRSTTSDTHGLMIPIVGVVGGLAGLSVELGGAAEIVLAGPDDVDRALSINLVGGLAWDLPVSWGRPRLTARYMRELAGGLDVDLRRQTITAGIAFGL